MARKNVVPAGEPKEWLTTADLARALTLHPETIQDLARQGKIPSIRVGKQYRFNLDAVVAVLGQSVAR